jgi:cell division protein ZapA (FtsZ GTPase activity inhibitor)
MGTLHLDILGTSFAIQSNEDDEYLNKLLNYFKQISNNIEKNTSLKNPTQIAILSGVLLCDEVYKEKAKNMRMEKNLLSDTDTEADRITSELISKIENALQND